MSKEGNSLVHPACFVRFLPHRHKDGILSSSPQGTSVNLEDMALVYTEQQGSSATRSVWTAHENKTRNKRGVTGLLNSCEDPEQSTSRLVIAHPSKSPGSVCWLLFFFFICVFLNCGMFSFSSCAHPDIFITTCFFPEISFSNYGGARS